MTRLNKLIVLTALSLVITACGSGKKDISMNVHSDPLGAYALMKVDYKKSKDSTDWIFLGPTPVVLDKSVKFSGATSISIRVIRPGFYEQTKTWTAKDFKREHARNKEINWLPSLVKQ